MDRAIDATALRKELQALIQRAETLATNLTAEEMFRRPSADKWSAAECLAHLNITVEQYLPNIKAAVEELQSGRTRKNRQTDPSVLPFIGHSTSTLVRVRFGTETP